MHPEIFKAAINEFGDDELFRFDQIVNDARSELAARPNESSQFNFTSVADAVLSAAASSKFQSARDIGDSALIEIEKEDSIRHEASGMRLVLATICLWQSDHASFRKYLKDDLDRTGNPIPLWKRMADMGLVLAEDWIDANGNTSWPNEIIEEVYLASLEELEGNRPKLKLTDGCKQTAFRIATWLLPRWFDSVPAAYESVRILMLLADNASRMNQHYSAIRYCEQAKGVSERILNRKQSEFAFFLSKYGDITHFAGLVAKDIEVARRGRYACLQAKRIADRNVNLQLRSYRYCAIVHSFLMTLYFMELAYGKIGTSTTVEDGLRELLTNLEIVDRRSGNLSSVIEQDIKLVTDHKIEPESALESLSSQRKTIKIWNEVG